LAAAIEQTKTESNPNSLADQRARLFERTRLDENSLPAALKQLNRTPAWLEECLHREACYDQACSSVLSDQARARTLATMRLPLTRCKFQILALNSREAAQEAFMCLKDDQLPPEQVAQECGVAWEEQQLFLEDLPADVQSSLLSAAPGDVLAPEPEDELFVVTRVMAKTEPALLDDQVRQRIDQHLLQSHFSELCSKHIRWVLDASAHE
jgi:hypothetical protein